MGNSKRMLMDFFFLFPMGEGCDAHKLYKYMTSIDKILGFVLHATFQMRTTPDLLLKALSENQFWPCL